MCTYLRQSYPYDKFITFIKINRVIDNVTCKLDDYYHDNGLNLYTRDQVQNLIKL